MSSSLREELSHGSKLPVLKDADGYEHWKRQLKSFVFKKAHIPYLDQLTPKSTLDRAYFKKHFKEEWKEASKAEGEDGSEIDQDPFEHVEFFTDCFDHALKTADDCFLPWLYDLYHAVHDSLSPALQEQASSVMTGDICGLLQAVEVSILFWEENDPLALDIEYSALTMEKDADNDLMKYLARLQKLMGQLKSKGMPVSDHKARHVLRNGLHPVVFEGFIRAAKRTPYASYDLLVKAVKEEASSKIMMAKLRDLKPGRAVSVLATAGAKEAAVQPDRLARMESILATLAAKVAAQTARVDSKGQNNTAECYQYRRTGKCNRADCRFLHVDRESRNAGTDNKADKWCSFHNSRTHSDDECRSKRPGQSTTQADAGSRRAEQANATTHGGYEFVLSNVALRGEASFASMDAAHSGGPKIDRWCVDGASTVHATYDRDRCFDIRAASVTVGGSNSSAPFIATEVGSTYVDAFDATTGKTNRIMLKDVIISEHFPFHIFSEIVCFKAKCTCAKADASWSFKTPRGAPLLHASQQLLGPTDGSPRSELYFIDEAPAAAPAEATRPARDLRAECAVSATTALSASKNLARLVERHLDHAHANFPVVAKKYGLTLPDPLPDCWACLMAKPRRISPDKASTRSTTRCFEGFATDAKGPFDTPTPEGYLYYFMILDLYCSRNWVAFAASQAEWRVIWPNFVRKVEAKMGKDRCVSFCISDGHKTNTQAAIVDFNDSRGIESITTAPYSQWQDPAERAIQTNANAARTNLIHGGGKPFMWGYAVRHASDATNRLPPPHPVAGHEGKSRLCISDPAMTPEKEMRTPKPFLCLALRTTLGPERRSNFSPRAEPCVHLYYDRSRKAYALLTIPNLHLVHSIEVKHITTVFPMRVTNELSNRLDAFLRPTLDDGQYARVHGPGGLLRRMQPAGAADHAALAQATPALLRQPVAGAPPGMSTTRGYNPTPAALQAACHPTSAPPADEQLYTADQLAARTPAGYAKAISGPDRDYWIPAIKKDFATLRDEDCFIKITSDRPDGPSPPGIEQRFKNKYRGEAPIRLADIKKGDWKARSVARGDRFKYGVHYDATAAPVVHTAAQKMLIAWAVQRGLLLFEWDQGAAFYGNKMDRRGVIVKLPAGYDPHSTELRPLNLPPLYAELAGALPGIPQGSLLHYKDVVPDLQRLGFKQADADPCIFRHRTALMATSLHVDDGVLAAPSREAAEKVLGPLGLASNRAITWGPLSHSLGIDFDVRYTPARLKEL